MKKITQIFSAIILLCTLFTNAQTPGDVAQTFGKTPGFNGSVNAIITQTDGKILVGGQFNAFNGITEKGFIRLNADGTKDTTFNTGTGFGGTFGPAFINTISLQTDGKIVIGGTFSSYNGVTANSIIRLNTDGSKDTSFITGNGFTNSGFNPTSNVQSIVIQPDGKILVGGNYSLYNNVAENRIIRLNTDGSKDTTFTTGTGFNNPVSTITLQADGKILIGGNFTTYNGVTDNRIIRLNTNGTKDTTFTTGTGFDITATEIVIQSDGKLIIAGGFTTYNGVTENRIIRLNSNGTKDTSFTTGSGFNQQVNEITIQPDDKILIGGNFSTYNGVAENFIIRLNTNGTKDTAFTTVFNYPINTINLLTDSKLFLGGDFTSNNGVTGNRIIKLNTNGSTDTSFNTGTGFDASVRVIVKQTDGKTIIGGDFNNTNGNSKNKITRLNTDNTTDTTFNTGTFNGPIYSIVIQPDGKIIAGGTYTTYNGVTENKIIRLNTDGTKDTSFITGTGFDNPGAYVSSIALQTDGKILVCGNFTTYKGIAANRIIRLNTDGTTDSTFNTGAGFDSFIRTIILQPDGKILVGGFFTTYNGVTENRIIRLNTDGTKDTSFITGTGFNNEIGSIAIQTDGKILVCGAFTTYNGVTENRIIRLNTNGTKDTSFTTGTGLNDFVYATLIDANGKILIGGQFTTYNGVTENRIIRLNTDGTKDTAFNTGSGFNISFSIVYAIKTDTNGKLLVGGDFTTYKNDTSSHFLIGLHTEASLNTDTFEQTTKVTIYPNPSNSIFNIAIDKNATVEVYDIVGKQIFTKKLFTGENTIDLAAYEKGIYLAKITNQENQTKTIKLIKE